MPSPSLPARAATRLGGLAALMCLWLPACAGAPKPKPLPTADPTVRPGNATPAQEERLKQALDLYRRKDPGFAAIRDELAAEPVTAWAMTIWFAADVARSQRSLRTTRDEWGRIAKGAENPLTRYAVGHLQAIAPAAVPCISREMIQNVGDRSKQKLGQVLLAEIGAPSLPELTRLAGDPQWQVRRSVAVCAGISDPELELAPLLEGLLADPEFAVRSTAARAMVERVAARYPAGGRDRDVAALDAALEPVLDRLAMEQDPFVRGEIVRALGRAQAGPVAAASIRTALAMERDRKAKEEMAGALGLVAHDQTSAEMLIDLLERSPREADPVTWGAIQRSLRRMSGYRRNLEPSGWRVWLSESETVNRPR